MGAIVVALTLTLPSSAAAAVVNKTVGFHPTDFAFVPNRVAIKMGDSVTWSNGGSEEPHNVHFEGETSSAPPLPAQQFTTEPRTFNTAGEYLYYCDFHGRGMSGVVYVNALGELPPDAQFTVSPKPGLTGQTVSFNAAGSSGTNNGAVAKYEWDLDGDGMFEVDTGATARTSRIYLAAQRLNVTLRVTDGQGATGTRTLPVQIDPAPVSTPDPAPAPESAPAPDPTPQPQPAALPPVTTPPSTTPAGRTPAPFSFRSAAMPSRVAGVVVKVTCPGRCRFTVKLSISASVARKARLGNQTTTIGRARGTRSSAGTKMVTIKLTRNARRRLARRKSVPAMLNLKVSDASGAITRRQRSLTLRR